MERQCGECTLCCTITRVPELNKERNVECPFVKKCEGCTIYNDRPQSCRRFECAWLKGDMPDWMRPDKVHVMVEKFPEDAPVVAALPEPGYETSWRTPETEKVLKEHYQARGISVVAPDNLALLAEGHTAESVKDHIVKATKKVGIM